MPLRARSVLVALGLFGPILAPALRAQDSNAIVDAYLGRLEALGFSGAALIADDGGTILRKGYGLADREAGIPITIVSVFSIGSITKQFTAGGNGGLHTTLGDIERWDRAPGGAVEARRD